LSIAISLFNLLTMWMWYSGTCD